MVAPLNGACAHLWSQLQKPGSFMFTSFYLSALVRNKMFYCGQIEGTFGAFFYCGILLCSVALLCLSAIFSSVMFICTVYCCTVVLSPVFSKQQCYSCHGASRQVSPAGQSIEAWNGKLGVSLPGMAGWGFPRFPSPRVSFLVEWKNLM